MHIDSLNYFFQVANSNSISTVAKNSHISQSALSQQISKLENKLNVQLFNRTNKGVSLTAEGEILFKYAESILDSYNKLQQELSNSINSKKYISIETVESIGLTILPMAISKLKKKFNSYTISLNSIDSSSNLNNMNKSCDIFISYYKPKNISNITTTLLGNDEIILVADKSFSINSIKKEQILYIPLILASDKDYLKTLLCNEFKEDDSLFDNANILYTTNSYFSALKGICTSKVATFVPKSIYTNYNSLYDIKEIKIMDLSLNIPIYINHSNSFYKNNREFVKSLKNILKSYFK